MPVSRSARFHFVKCPTATERNVALIKRPPVDPNWYKGAACEGMPPELWDLDMKGNHSAGQRMCVSVCTVRESCLRKALDFGDVGVVRGGIKFKEITVIRGGEEQRIEDKRRECVLCHYITVSSTSYEDICYVCQRWTPCLRDCGRMVKRLPNIGSYYCKFCKIELEAA